MALFLNACFFSEENMFQSILSLFSIVFFGPCLKHCGNLWAQNGFCVFLWWKSHKRNRFLSFRISRLDSRHVAYLGMVVFCWE